MPPGRVLVNVTRFEREGVIALGAAGVRGWADGSVFTAAGVEEDGKKGLLKGWAVPG